MTSFLKLNHNTIIKIINIILVLRKLQKHQIYIINLLLKFKNSTYFLKHTYNYTKNRTIIVNQSITFCPIYIYEILFHQIITILNNYNFSYYFWSACSCYKVEYLIVI